MIKPSNDDNEDELLAKGIIRIIGNAHRKKKKKKDVSSSPSSTYAFANQTESGKFYDGGIVG